VVAVYQFLSHVKLENKNSFRNGRGLALMAE
jgi:hypothetical protein